MLVKLSACASRKGQRLSAFGVVQGLRNVLRVTELDQVIQTCVALGWPDEAFPANAVVSRRKSVAEAAVFVGFED